LLAFVGIALSSALFVSFRLDKAGYTPRPSV
jgi:hypothetical protein